MKIELRKISINQRLSEETVCFSADVVIDGKKVGEASNHGHGGPTSYHIKGVNLDAVKEAARAWIADPANATDEDRKLIEPYGTGYQPDPIEFLIDLLVDAHQRAKEEVKIAKMEAKNAALFAARGLPHMITVRTWSIVTSIGLKSDDAATIERALAHVKSKYGEIKSYAVVATKGT